LMGACVGLEQSTAMASEEVSEEAVYLNTGNPLPTDIEHIATVLLNDPFTDTFNSALPLSPPPSFFRRAAALSPRREWLWEWCRD
jgi:hypothetical protein